MDKKQIVADLHNHTTASDGDFTPEELVRKAKACGVKAVGVTDHDTVSGLVPAVKEGIRSGVDVICGVEVSVRFKREIFTGTLHVLCYFSRDKLEDSQFMSMVSDVLSQGRGETLVRARVAEINRHFGPGGKMVILERDLTFEDIAALSENASRRHFAMALNHMGITDKDVVNRIIGNDSPAYLPSGVDLESAAALIRTRGVLAVLAHPAAGSFPGEGHYKEVLPPVEIVAQLLPEFLDAGVKGLEVFYPGHTREHQEKLAEWAKQHQLVMTGGSDCHDDGDRPFGVQGLTSDDFECFMEQLSKA